MSLSGPIIAAPQMKHILRIIVAISNTSTSVLISGETGTGKEIIAQTIHKTSIRANKPFIGINCGAIPSELMESELFGHEKGAFSGAHKKAIGKLEYANGGTVFLDEISSLHLPLQAKLLRVLQEKTFEPVGSLTQVKLDVRFIAATNSNLVEDIKKGKFREDLYYRLNVLPINIPPLRERVEEIPLLFNYFAEKYAKEQKKIITGIEENVKKLFMAYSWPGNIRELQNIMEMLVSLTENGGIIREEALPKNFFESEEKKINFPLEYEQIIRSFERKIIIKILEKSGWKKNKAAKLMQIHRNTLSNKLKQLGISTPDLSKNDDS